MALAALNGLLGDRLDEPLAIPMAVRRVGGPATPRLAVFLHGLVETEDAWALGRRPTYGERLATDLGTRRCRSGTTPAGTSRTTAGLSELLDTVTEHWPVEVESIALVGHSMGGLVARSACRIAFLDDRPWVGGVRHVVSLGSPHLGAPLEQAVHYASAGLATLPETRPFRAPTQKERRHPRSEPGFARRRGLARSRSRRAPRRGVQRGPAPRRRDVLLRLRDHHPQPEHPLGRLLGDGMVLVPSASGLRIGLKEEHGLVLGGTHHLALLNHPEV